jgi:DNA-binding response OmpR family regulator
MTKETILVVEDSSEIAAVLKDGILVRLGYNVLTATDGRTGLNLAVQHHPDLIFLDMNLPILSGMEMLMALRQTDCASPVIFMTVFGSESIAVEAFRLGVHDYLKKPFTQDEVKQAIDRALKETRLIREQEELNRNLIVAETVRTTIVTLSHYLNNYTLILNTGLVLLNEGLQQKLPDPALLKLVQNSLTGVHNIQAVMRVLRQTADVNLTSYTPTTPMIDIEALLKKELEKKVML